MTRYAITANQLGGEANEAAAHLWNPSSTISLYLVRTDIMVSETTGGFSRQYLVRTTTQGTTPGSTVTPDADNAFDRRAAPPSGALVYTGNFNTTPVASAQSIATFTSDRRYGELKVWTFPGRGIRIPPGQGIGWFALGGLSSTLRQFGFTWDE